MKFISIYTLIISAMLLGGGASLMYWWPGASHAPHTERPQGPLFPSLSESPALPSPVLQLKQAMTAGHIETRTPSLPLIRGDLQQFSDDNLDADLPTSPKVASLQQRLQRLQAMQRHLDH
ncbi:hypothetical protein LQM11_004443 [Vibrio parahaemolyticus]|nr:hypothetical protein [Vibrio parahaemolyticus]